jgi:hypothetical protein
MSNKKETAVEYLTKEFSDILGPLDTKPMQDLLLVDAIKRAKEMEKQEIIDAWENGYEHGACVNEDEAKYHGIQYYNETYGGQNND